MQKISTLPVKNIRGKFTYKILGIPFVIFLVNKAGMKQLGSDAYAYVMKDPEPYAVFTEEHLEDVTVLHEVFHMFMYTTFSHSQDDLSSDDMEEISADLVSYRHDQMKKAATEIKDRLVKIKEKK